MMYLSKAEEIGNIDNQALNLINKARILFLLKKFNQAKELCDKAMLLLQEGNNDMITLIENTNIIFQYHVLSAKIAYALGDKKRGKNKLLKLLETSENKFEIAELNYELWHMETEEDYRNEALRLYQEITVKGLHFHRLF